MPIQSFLTETAISLASGVSKVVLRELLNQSGHEDEKGSIIPYRSDGNKSILCLVHGFSGDAEKTFKPMPEFITEDDDLGGWDVISIGYSTNLLPDIGMGIWAADPDIARIAGFLQTNLKILFNHYDRVALLGHSMGGLVIQRAILNLKDTHKITHVLFYGTPSGGLKKASGFKWFKRQISDMSEDGPFISTLRNDWSNRFVEDYPFKFATVAGESDEFVPPVSSLKPFPEKYHYYTSGNHTTMTKPGTAQDTSYLILKNHLTDNTSIITGSDSDVSNLIARYHVEVNNLGSKLEQLDKNGFRSYIFALEGTNKLDQAIDTIEKSHLLSTNTDVMGILGGRYKRKYLQEGTQEFLDKAIEWYNKALQLSEQNNNSSQIFYHAINLAFLHLMRDESDTKRYRELAEKALHHCELENGENYWDDATRAEASLYLNDFENSKMYYKQAVVKAGGDIRAVSSMRINAMYAIKALNRHDWEEELGEILGD